MSADLHVHTCLSDGTKTPEEVVRLAKAAGLSTIAITDHDVVAGIEPAKTEGEKEGIEVIPGIEFTTEIPGTEIHILGYYINYKDENFLEIITKIQKGREKRIYKIMEKLIKLGIEIDPKEVFEIAGHRSPGRPHVARALVKNEIVKSIGEAFKRYLDFKGPAYEPHYRLTPTEAVKLVTGAKGIPVYAHPGASNSDEIIPELISAGLKGIEIYYPGHNSYQVKHYKTVAQKYGLLITGGTDYHGSGGVREMELGTIKIEDELVEKLKNEHLCRN